MQSLDPNPSPRLPTPPTRPPALPDGMFVRLSFQEEKKLKALKFLRSQLFSNIQVILLILCTSESLSDFTCIYKYNI